MPRTKEAIDRARREQDKKRATDPNAKRTAIWLDPPTVAKLDRKRRMYGEDRVAFVRRLIEEHY
jgi:hypothetical protein